MIEHDARISEIESHLIEVAQLQVATVIEAAKMREDIRQLTETVRSLHQRVGELQNPPPEIDARPEESE